ncbi:hypothetical protein C6N01_13125 [Enterococcus faecalis]|uniref:hypothetical protein n=1 Tax=Enterococcus faecalis TaxID=1351 RepID=UPI00136345CF|nr:hypothetical protein [Enterococcus faecalis]NBJ47150.1 hypothetical protein [Enterococcus faecalis]
MRKKYVVVLFSICLVFFSVITYLFNSSMYKTQEFNGSVETRQNVIKFKAKLTEKPKKVENSDDYYLIFDNVKAMESKNDEELVVLNNGGVVITRIPKGIEPAKGDTILVSIQKQFATSYSEPPQLLGNSVIEVQFEDR